MNSKKIQFQHWTGFLLVVVCGLFFVTGCARFSKHKSEGKPTAQKAAPAPSAEKVTPEVSAEKSSDRLKRLSDGFTNVIFGPVELVYQMKEEVKKTDPVRGFLSGLIKGISWFGLREGVGIFEMVTFYSGAKPQLKPFNTDWVYA